MRTVETKRRDRLVPHEQHARPGVMCGHVNWRVIDEQITWRSIRQRMLGTSAFRASARTSERERAWDRGGEREKIAAFLVLADIRAIGRFLARLHRAGISPTTFRRRGCTPRFGEDLVINHDAAISQSNVRSLARMEVGRRGSRWGARKRRRRRRSGREREGGREKGGHLLITSAPINTASNKERLLHHQWERSSEKVSRWRFNVKCTRYPMAFLRNHTHFRSLNFLVRVDSYVFSFVILFAVIAFILEQLIEQLLVRY